MDSLGLLNQKQKPKAVHQKREKELTKNEELIKNEEQIGENK
jgi:hypothetical protein